MPFYKWSESLSVGVTVIDSDHQALIRLINRLHDAVHDQEDALVLDEIFDSLIAYVELHFAREEQVMEVCGYPAIAEHKQEHLRFAQDMRYTRDRYFKGGEAGVGPELLGFLKDWLTRHILVEDMAYKPFVESSELVEQVAAGHGPGLSEQVDKATRRW